MKTELRNVQCEMVLQFFLALRASSEGEVLAALLSLRAMMSKRFSLGAFMENLDINAILHNTNQHNINYKMEAKHKSVEGMENPNYQATEGIYEQI